MLKAQNINWKEEVSGPHLAAIEAIYKELRGLQDTFVPLGRRRSRTRPKWATAATRKAVKDKMRLWKAAETGAEGDMTAELKEASKKL